MLRIMNACLKLQMVPKNWKKGNIYPIAKTEEFSGELDKMRPIMLLEHAKKILTKLLTRRLSDKLSRHEILNENNYVALPNTSTEVPIATIMHIIEDVKVN